MGTGQPFNDAYRYMDWLLTVPLLLMELVLVMKVEEKEAQQKSATLGAAAALMILLGLAQKMTVVSWCTYPVVYIFPMLGFSGAGAIVGIQIGYCVSDIISKCGVGLLTYNICKAKSANYVKMED